MFADMQPDLAALVEEIRDALGQAGIDGYERGIVALDSLTSALRSRQIDAPPVSGDDEVGWLIEALDEPMWWTGWPGSIRDVHEFWTRDSNKAVRFARREDAETIAHYNFDGECRVTEHMWMTPRERLEARLSQHVKEAAERVGNRVAERVAETRAITPPPERSAGWPTREEIGEEVVERMVRAFMDTADFAVGNGEFEAHNLHNAMRAALATLPATAPLSEGKQDD